MLPDFILNPVRMVVQSSVFEVLSILNVVVNAMILGMERFDAPQTEIDALRNANYVLTILFGGAFLIESRREMHTRFPFRSPTCAVEVLLRWGSIGIRHWHDGVNVAEGAVLLVSIIDIGAQFSGVARGSPLASLRVVRAFRVLRLSFISSAWVKVLRRIGRVRAAATKHYLQIKHNGRFSAASPQAVPSAASASLLSFVFTIIFAGMRIFLFRSHFDFLPLAKSASLQSLECRCEWPGPCVHCWNTGRFSHTVRADFWRLLPRCDYEQSHHRNPPFTFQ